MSKADVVRAGFIPLLDAAMLVAAREGGFAAAEGISLELVRETSWANIRDRVAIGHFDVAHMLAPLPIAASLKLTPLATPMIAPMALGLGGNAVCVSRGLWAEMVEHGARSADAAAANGAGLRGALAARRARGLGQAEFAVVHPFSSHNYELRYWLASCGINPERDVSIGVVAPSFLPDALASGRIEGFCAGEPWSSAAVAAGSGRIAVTKAAILRAGPEKVLGMRAEWAARNPALLTRLLRALDAAARWCDGAENRARLALWLARPEYLGVAEALLLPGLSGRIPLGDALAADVPGFLDFARGAATFPWQSHALWFYAQMRRWGHAPDGGEAVARRVYRPDLYRAALPDAATPPGGGMAALAATDFFDGEGFDPADIGGYLSRSMHLK